MSTPGKRATGNDGVGWVDVTEGGPSVRLKGITADSIVAGRDVAINEIIRWIELDAKHNAWMSGVRIAEKLRSGAWRDELKALDAASERGGVTHGKGGGEGGR